MLKQKLKSLWPKAAYAVVGIAVISFSTAAYFQGGSANFFNSLVAYYEGKTDSGETYDKSTSHDEEGYTDSNGVYHKYYESGKYTCRQLKDMISAGKAAPAEKKHFDDYCAKQDERFWEDEPGKKWEEHTDKSLEEKRPEKLKNEDTSKSEDKRVEEKRVPPAGYEDEVLNNYSDVENPFSDTNMNTTEGKAFYELYRRAVIGGYKDGTARGENLVNRAEAAKFLALARYGTVSEEKSDDSNLRDIRGQWFEQFVRFLYRKGVISGHPDGTFRGGDSVTTAEFNKMMVLTFGLEENLPFGYLDVSSEDWHAKYAGAAEKHNFYPDRKEYLEPHRPLTRNEVAVAIYNLLVEKSAKDIVKN